MLFTEDYLKRKIILNNEQNGLHCTCRGDFYYPNLVYSKNDYLPLGKSGVLLKPYLKEIFKALFNKMLLLDELCPHETRTRCHRTAQSRRPVAPGAENGLYPQCRRSVCFAGGGKLLKTVAGFRGSVPCIRPLHNPKDPFVPRKRLSAPFFLQSFGISAMIGTVKRTKGRYGV